MQAKNICINCKHPEVSDIDKEFESIFEMMAFDTFLTCPKRDGARVEDDDSCGDFEINKEIV